MFTFVSKSYTKSKAWERALSGKSSLSLKNLSLFATLFFLTMTSSACSYSSFPASLSPQDIVGFEAESIEGKGCDTASLKWKTPPASIGKVRLTWKGGVDGLDRGEKEVASAQAPSKDGISSYDLRRLHGESEYSISLEAVSNTNVRSANAAVATVKTGDCGDLEAPTVFSAEAPLTKAHNSVALTWTNPEQLDFSGITISYKRTSDTETNEVEVPSSSVGAAGKTITYIIEGLMPDTQYQFTVTSMDHAGNEVRNGTTVSQGTASLPTISSPTFTSNAKTHNSVTLTWTNPSYSDDFNIAITYGPKGSSSTDTVTVTGASATSQSETITGLSLETEYTFSAIAVDASDPAILSPSATLDVTTDVAPTISSPTFTSNAETDNSVTLTWTNPSYSDDFNIAITYGPKGSSTTDTVTVTGASATSQSETITGLSSETDYTFSAIAVDASDPAILSPPVTQDVTTDVAPAISSPTFASNTKTHNSVTLTWTNPSYSDDFNIAITYGPKGSSTTDTVTVTGASATSQSETITGLSPETEYTFSAIAVDASDAAILSPPVTQDVRTNDTPAISAPVNFAEDTKTHDSVTLTWTNPSFIGNFNIVITYEPDDGSSSADTVTVTGASATTQSETIRGLLPEKAYTFSIKAVDTGRNREAASSVTVAVTTDAVATILPPTLNSATGSAYNAVTLVWVNPDQANFAGVEIQYTEDGGSGDAGTKRVPSTEVGSRGDTITYTIEGLTSPDTQYQFTVRSIDSGGNVGENSDSKDALTKPLPTISAPTFTSNTKTHNSVTLTWTNPSYADDFNIEITYGPRGSSTTDTVSVTGASATSQSKTISDLAEEGTEYTFTIKAVDANDAVIESNPATVFVTTDTSLSAPTDFTASKITLNSVTLTWTNPPSYTGNFKIVISYGNEGIVITENSIQEQTITGLSHSTPYTFTIKAVDVNDSTIEATGSDEGVTTATPLSAPTFTSNTKTYDSVTLAWTNPPSYTGNFKIVISYGGNEEEITDNNIEEKTITGLSPSTPYTFAIKAVDADDDTIEAIGIAVNVTTATEPIPAPTAFVEKAKTYNTVTLGWVNPNYTGNFKIVISYNGNEEVITENSIEEKTITGLSHSTLHTFTIKAVDTTDPTVQEVSPTTVSVTTAIPISAPENFREKANTKTHNSVTLTWANPSSFSGNFKIVISYGGNEEEITDNSIEEKTITGLSPEADYTFTIKAVDTGIDTGIDTGTNTEAASLTAVSVRTELEPLSVPTFTSNTKTHDSVTLIWTNPIYITGNFKIEITYGTNTKTVLGTSGSPQSVRIAELSPETDYTFSARAVDGMDTSKFSASTTETVRTEPLPSSLSALLAPTGLTATVTGTSVELIWTNPSYAGSNGFKIVISNNYGGGSKEITDGSESITIDNLLPGTDYTFTAQAVDASDDAIVSISNPTQSFTTSGTLKAPSPESFITRQYVRWSRNTASDGLTIPPLKNEMEGFILYQDGESVTYARDGNTTTTRYVADLDGLVPKGNEAQFRLQEVYGYADGQEVKSPLSDIYEYEDTRTTAIGAPTDLTASDITDNSVTLTWTNPSPYTYEDQNYVDQTLPFKVRITHDHGGSYAELEAEADEEATLTIDNLLPGTEYTFRAQARVENNGLIVSTKTGAAAITTTGTSPLGKPAPPSAAQATDNSVTLSWTNPSGGTSPPFSKVVLYKNGEIVGDGSITKIHTSYEVTGLSPGVSYDFQIQRVYAHADSKALALESLKSDAVSLTTTGGILPTIEAPTGLTATVTGTSVELNWTNPSYAGSNGFKILISHNYSKSPKEVLDTDTNPETLTIDNLLPGTEYTFTVRAVDESDLNIASLINPSQTVITEGIFEAPPALRLWEGGTAISDDYIIVNYESEGGEPYWPSIQTDPPLRRLNIYAKKSDGTETIDKITEASSLYYFVHPLSPGTTYDFQVTRVYGYNGGQEVETPRSEAVEFTTTQ